MIKGVLAGLFLALAAISPPAPSNAATLIVDSEGELVGATGVSVGGILYDVALVDGSCVALFNGCDQQSDFLFTDVGMASAAASALMEQVFIDIANPQLFDSNPLFARGCEGLVECIAYVPYLSSTGMFGQATAINHPFGPNDSTSTATRAATYDFTNDSGGFYAVFSIPAIPEPATWAMMLLGFGFIGFSMRRKNFKHAVAPVG